MTTELIRTDDAVLAELPYPDQNADYVAAQAKLAQLELELSDLKDEIATRQSELDELHVEDSDSAEVAASLELDIEALTRKADKLAAVVEEQRNTVAEVLRRAKREFERAAKKAWVDEYVPELMSLMDRLLEIRDIYSKLKGSGPLNPPYPHAFSRALGKSDVWLKARKAEWFKHTE